MEQGGARNRGCTARDHKTASMYITAGLFYISVSVCSRLASDIAWRTRMCMWYVHNSRDQLSSACLPTVRPPPTTWRVAQASQYSEGK